MAVLLEEVELEQAAVLLEEVELEPAAVTLGEVELGQAEVELEVLLLAEVEALELELELASAHLAPLVLLDQVSTLDQVSPLALALALEALEAPSAELELTAAMSPESPAVDQEGSAAEALAI